MKLPPIAILRRRPQRTSASSPKRDRMRPLAIRAALILGLALIAALGLFASEVWAQKPPVAEKPLNLTGQVVAGGIQLNWEAPAARAAEVDGYQVYRRRPDQGETLLLVLVANTGSTATSYLDATATEPGVSYIYRVRARRGTELSRMANKLQLTYTAPEPLIATQSQATQPQATPSELAPSNLRAAISGDGVQLAWEAPAVDAGSVTSHFVTRLWTNAQGRDMRLLLDSGSTALSYLDPEANVEGVVYTYMVLVARGAVYSQDSNRVTVTYLLASLAPTNLRVESTPGGVQLEWDAPAEDAFSVTGYRIIRTRSDVHGGPKVTTEIDIDSTDSSYLDTEADEEGSTYTYRVKALRDQVSSEASNEPTVTYLWESLAPSNLRAMMTVDGIRLWWDAPTADPALVTGYRIMRAEAGANGGAGVSTEIDTGTIALSYLDATVQAEGASFTYQVTALSGDASGGASNEATVTYSQASLAPTDLHATMRDDAVHLQWNAPVADAGSVTAYRFTRTTTKANGTQLTSSIYTQATALAFTDIFVDVTASAYTYQVVALRRYALRDEVLVSAASNESTVDVGLARSPSNLRAESWLDGIALRWDPPRGSDLDWIISYSLKRSLIGVGTGPRTVTRYVHQSALEYFDRNGLVVGQTYRYTVSASYWDDGNRRSEALNLTYLPEAQGLPTAPSGLRAVYQPDGAIALEWDPPTEDAASVTGYEVISRMGQDKFVDLDGRWGQPHSDSVDSATTSYRSTSPSGWGTALSRQDWGYYYNFSVRALRADGETSLSDDLSVQPVPQTQALRGPDDDYSADTSTTAQVAVGGSVVGNMETAEDRDWFAVELQAGQTYFIDLLQERTPGNFEEHGKWITSVHDSEGRSIPGTMAANTYNELLSDETELQFTPSASGTHYIAVGNIEDATWFLGGPYTVAVRAVWLPELQRGEVGEETDSARLINVGEPVLSNIDYMVRTPEQAGRIGEWLGYADIDWWRVRLEQDVSYSITMKGWATGDGTLIDPQILRLRDAYGTPDNETPVWDDVGGQVGPPTDYVNRNSLSIFTPRVAGDYHILATARNDFFDYQTDLEYQELGTYTMDVSVIEDLTPDVPADAQSTALVVSDGEPYVGRIVPIFDRDWVAVELEAANTYHIKVNAFSGHGVPIKRVGSAGVFSANGLRLPGSGMYRGGDGQPSYYNAAIVTPGESGTYYIDVRGQGREVGDYSVWVQLVHTVTQAVIDDIAVGVEMLNVNDPLVVALRPRQSQWFGIELHAGVTYYFLHATNADWDAVIHGLYDDSGELVAWDPGNEKPAVERRELLQRRRLSYTPLSAGTHYIQVGRGVKPSGSALAAVDYTLSVFLVETGAQYQQEQRDSNLFDEIDRELETTLEPGVMTSDEAVLQGEVRWYTMALEGGARYWLSVRTVPPEDSDPALIDPSLAQPQIRAVFTDEGDTVYSAPLAAGRTYDIDLDLFPEESCLYHFGILSQYVAAYNVSVTKQTNGYADAAVCGQADDGSGGGESDEDDDSNGDSDVDQVVEQSIDLSAGIDTTGVVEVGVIARGKIEVVGDTDWFRVLLNEGVTYQIDMEGAWTGHAHSNGLWVGVGTLVDPLLSGIYDALGELIPGSGDLTEEGNGGTGQNSRFVFTPATSGDYFIEAGATSAWLGTYILTVTELE